jgi:amino acid adenylation domain-containing protein
MSPARASTESNPASTNAQPILARDPTRPCPLSPSQEHIYFLEQLNPGAPLCNEADAVRLKGQLDIEALERAMNVIITRHEVLRSTIQVVNGIPLAVVHQNRPLVLKRIDLRDLPEEKRNADVERLLIEEPRRPYNLQNQSGIRATVIQLAADEHIFILMMHQIIFDRLSVGILWHELGRVYPALLRGLSLSLPPLPVQYGDYAAWQRDPEKEANYGADLAFWKENLQGAQQVLDLPADRPRPETLSHGGDKKSYRIGPGLVAKLRNLSRQEQTNLFNIFAASLNTLLYRYSGQDDILLGISTADRNRAELQPLIGCLVDMQILRTKLAGCITWRELLRRVNLGLASVYMHKNIPFERVLKAVAADSCFGNSPPFRVTFNWHDQDAQRQFVGLPDLLVEPLPTHSGISRFDLTFNVTNAIHDVLIEVEYSTDLFEEDRIERMVGHYRTLLGAVAADPDCRLADIPLLTDAERRRILLEWNRTEIEHPTNRCIHQLFEEQVERAPEALAVVAGDKQLTYHELNARANQLARHLKTFGVGPDKLVGICIGRSLDMIVALLGVLKAGGAYLPLDPDYPQERLAFMLDDAGADVLLTHQGLCRGAAFGRPTCKVFCLDSDWATVEELSSDNLKNEVSTEDLVYMIYTSGSTGEPKGVELTHSGLLNLVFWHCRTYQVTPSDRATQLAGVGFDASVWELWPYLCSGASIHIPDEAARLLPDKLRDWLVERKITLTFVPTPLAEAMIALPWPSDAALRTMLTGGDRLTLHLPLSLPFSLVNHYGPTECTVVTTCANVSSGPERTKAPPIGRPIDNAKVYILDAHLQPVPIGVPGELHIGGLGLARGYHNRPELTAEKFIANPFSPDSEARLYKTGDLACYLPNGMIHFLGRNDAQIKIRGFRIELGEIESVLARHPCIAAAAVIARGGGAEDKHLVAYIILNLADLTSTDLREYLKQKMPEYMVPSVFVVLDRLPLTTNGKLDRAGLPAPDGANTLRDQTSVAPLTRIEKTVADILASLLKLTKVDRETNFFALGGHSLLGTQLIARIRDALGIDLPLRRIFDSPTVASLSAEIEGILIAEVEAMSEEEVQRSLFGPPATMIEGV